MPKPVPAGPRLIGQISRAGWNMVTRFSIDEARSFSLDQSLDTATRHARAVEFAEVAKGLWYSCDDNAVVEAVCQSSGAHIAARLSNEPG